MKMKPISPCLWFDTQAEAAAKFYCSIFPNSKVISVAKYTKVGPRKEGSPMLVTFKLNGQTFLGLNGGPNFPFTEAISLTVTCKDQKEINHYWSKLKAGGGREVECGWLVDKFGLRWQVVPAVMEKMQLSKNRKKADAAMSAMVTMKKFDIAKLQKAFDDA